MAKKRVKTEPSETLQKKARAEPRFSMKLLIDSGTNRVLFAEADKGCVDFLFFILSLPVSTLIRLVGKQNMKGMIGSVSNLYESVETLDPSFVLENITKDSLLKLPITPNFSGYNMIPGATEAAEKKKILYRCKRSFPYTAVFNNPYGGGGGAFSPLQDCRTYVSESPRGICPACKSLMSSGSKLEYVVAPAEGEGEGEGEGFVKDVVKFVVMDDLVVKPVTSVMCSINLFTQLGVKNVSELEEKVVVLGIQEGVKLLKASLESKNVLTSVFLK